MKIGRSTLNYLWERVRQLQIGNPKRLVVRRVVVGGAALEAVLHERLADHHVRGDWFDGSAAAVVALLDRGQEQQPRGIGAPESGAVGWLSQRQGGREDASAATA